MELQLKAQRIEAGLVREKAAIADIIASATGLIPAARQSFESVNSEIASLRSAVVRWQLELGPTDMARELHKWESLLLGAATNHAVELQKGEWGEPEKSFGILNHMTSTLCSVALNWHNLAEFSREQVVRDSREARIWGAKELEGMTGVKLRE
ncbi:hypothetical protein LOC59_11265 [Arthrobacter sp. zg-Y916]|uniref:hypothetical protein n=1 Tax=Arthrobacter sp. zg-Y916 TaxID=2894190 RepID=UPI001E2A9FBA|nr:hypothetical protein [Arthrobacter sp. zg-Y916]MCC9194217.1 hypothetical protein [Arthrobacter sp. zg-Y916]